MITSDNGLRLIKQFEGFSSKPYRCPAGVPTIGYGSTYYDDGAKVTMDDDPISEADATKLLKAVLKPIEQAVFKLIKTRINQNQFDAFVSFTYNVGVNAFKNSTMLSLFNMLNSSATANEFLKWDHVKGKVVKGLSARREAERKLFLS